MLVLAPPVRVGERERSGVSDVGLDVRQCVCAVFGRAGAREGVWLGAPEAAAAAWAGAPRPARHRGLAPALYTLGGPGVLLYLYARVSRPHSLLPECIINA